MKRDWVLWLICFILLTTGACGTKSDLQEAEGGNIASGISAGYFESDGIIEPLDANELITKLSRLEAGMSIEDVADFFGKEPFTVIETGEDVYQYYSGDITITLWGKELFQVKVKVDHGESCIWLALQPETFD